MPVRRSARLLVGLLMAMPISAASLAETATQAGPPQAPASVVRLARKHPAPAKAPITRMNVDSWVSLGPMLDPLANPDAHIDMHARDTSDEDIIVYDKTFKRPQQDLTREEVGAEPGQSEAAQSYVPFLGSGCDKGSVCVDPGQQGLISAIPSLFGAH
jgi:hypothetical protein